MRPCSPRAERDRVADVRLELSAEPWEAGRAAKGGVRPACGRKTKQRGAVFNKGRQE